MRAGTGKVTPFGRKEVGGYRGSRFGVVDDFFDGEIVSFDFPDCARAEGSAGFGEVEDCAEDGAQFGGVGFPILLGCGGRRRRSAFRGVLRVFPAGRPRIEPVLLRGRDVCVCSRCPPFVEEVLRIRKLDVNPGAIKK